MVTNVVSLKYWYSTSNFNSRVGAHIRIDFANSGSWYDFRNANVSDLNQDHVTLVLSQNHLASGEERSWNKHLVSL